MAVNVPVFVNVPLTLIAPDAPSVNIAPELMVKLLQTAPAAPIGQARPSGAGR